MRRLETRESGFETEFRKICERASARSKGVEAAVRTILDDVRRRGDTAVAEYTRRFDGVALRPDEFEVPRARLAEAGRALDRGTRSALDLAARRIRVFHQRGLLKPFRIEGRDGVRLEERIVALERVGLYVPGGKAAYPSTVLMCAVPAKAAGVEEVIVTTPASREGSVRGIVLAACVAAGVDRVFAIGGAQAIGALAYGTKTIPRVDKIVGPGNLYVATAKRLVFGEVAIDSVAGPSEVLVIADGTVPAAWAAADLLSQAEHDEMALALLVTTSEAYAEEVEAEVRRQLPGLATERVARGSLRSAVAIVVRDLDEAADIANRFAPEHLELLVRGPEKLVPKLRNAGAVFLGAFTPEAVGDYLAGPNHVLPTGGTARFLSPLSAADFQRRTNVIGFSRGALERLGPSAAAIADLEGFDAHARSVRLRLEKAGKARKPL